MKDKIKKVGLLIVFVLVIVSGAIFNSNVNAQRGWDEEGIDAEDNLWE